MPRGYTTITAQPETRDRLKARGSKGESYDELLRRLLDETADDE